MLLTMLSQRGASAAMLRRRRTYDVYILARRATLCYAMPRLIQSQLTPRRRRHMAAAHTPITLG